MLSIYAMHTVTSLQQSWAWAFKFCSHFVMYKTSDASFTLLFQHFCYATDNNGTVKWFPCEDLSKNTWTNRSLTLYNYYRFNNNRLQRRKNVQRNSFFTAQNQSWTSKNDTIVQRLLDIVEFFEEVRISTEKNWLK